MVNSVEGYLSFFLELIEPKAALFAQGCWGALYKYLNRIEYFHLEKVSWSTALK